MIFSPLSSQGNFFCPFVSLHTYLENYTSEQGELFVQIKVISMYGSVPVKDDNDLDHGSRIWDGLLTIYLP